MEASLVVSWATAPPVAPARRYGSTRTPTNGSGSSIQCTSSTWPSRPSLALCASSRASRPSAISGQWYWEWLIKSEVDQISSSLQNTFFLINRKVLPRSPVALSHTVRLSGRLHLHDAGGAVWGCSQGEWLEKSSSSVDSRFWKKTFFFF